MKKAALFLIGLTVFLQPLSANVREIVFLVRPNILESTKEQLMKQSRLWKNVDEERSKWFEALSEGGHGSGFLYVDENGDKYIITNRHVVAHAESADIVQRIEGEETVFEDCPVVFMSDTVDIAILAFPSGEASFAEGFQPSFEKPNDGDEVISAGYPGYGKDGEALWQFARGHITNNQAVFDDLVNDDVESFLQHSANIDGGNSGGPLLVEDDLNGGYRVVGVNTFVLRDRDNTFFAIPVEAVAGQFLKALDILSGTAAGDAEEDLTRTCEAFADAVNDEDEAADRLNPYYAEAYVSLHGLTAVLDIIEDKANPKAGDMREFFSERPWKAMRQVVLEESLEKLRTGTISYAGTAAPGVHGYLSGDHAAVETSFDCGGRDITISWIHQYGKWRISELSFDGEPSDPVRPRRGPGPLIEWLRSLRNPDAINHSAYVLAGLPISSTDNPPLGYRVGNFGIGLGYAWHSGSLPIYASIDMEYNFTNLEYSWINSSYRGGLKLSSTFGFMMDFERFGFYGGGGFGVGHAKFIYTFGDVQWDTSVGWIGEIGVNLYMGDRKRLLLGFEFSVDSYDYSTELGVPKRYFGFDSDIRFGYRW